MGASHSHPGHSHLSHEHGAHTHAISPDADRGKLRIALGLILILLVVEVVAGILANSLALLSDAGHMLTDAAAIGFSLVAIRLAKRPAHGAMTFGLRRSEILSAQINGTTLLVLSLLIAVEAVRRLFSPPEVEAGLILGVALFGVLVNLLATSTLAQANREKLNVEGSYQHILTDLFAFIGTAIAAVVILATGFQRADPIASLFVAALMLRSAYGLLRETGRVFMEASPRGIDPQEIGQRMAATDGVIEIHDLHVWEVTSGFPSLSAHVTVGCETDCHRVRLMLAELLEHDFEIAHTTIQVEHQPEKLLEIGGSGRS